MEYNSADELVERAEEHERIVLTYNSVYTTVHQTIEGNVREANDVRWSRIVTDSGNSYALFGHGLRTRDVGDVTKNGRKIGEFVSATAVRS